MSQISSAAYGSAIGVSLEDFFNALEDTGASDALMPHLDTLEITARAGNADSIEIMLQLALRSDDIGKVAETKLFDIFSNDDFIRNGTAKDIGRQSLKLFEILGGSASPSSPATQGNSALFRNDNNLTKLSTPSKVLYMAGAEARESRSDVLLQQIGSAFSETSTQTSEWLPPGTSGTSLWDDNRFLSNDELDARAEQLKAATEHTAAEVAIHKTIRSADLNDLIDNGGQSFPLLVPVHENAHFNLLFFKSSTEATCYSSLTDKLSNISKTLENKNIATTSFEINLQDNAPNACGLFVLECLKRLLSDPSGNSLMDFVAEFQRLTAEEQAIRNQSWRRSLHGALLG